MSLCAMERVGEVFVCRCEICRENDTEPRAKTSRIKPERPEIGRDYLLVAWRPAPEFGMYQMFSERRYLADNLVNFSKNFGVDIHAISIYELKAVNQ